MKTFREWLNKSELAEGTLISNAEEGIFDILKTKYKKLGVISVSINHSSLYEITALAKNNKKAQINVGNSDIRSYGALADALAKQLD